ncbi:MAG: hypothetical protein ACJAVA_000196 [Flavobacteriaceae bacterium]|jgi:hypothetical protein
MRYIKNNLQEQDPNLTIGEYLVIQEKEKAIKDAETEKRRNCFINYLKGEYIKVVDSCPIEGDKMALFIKVEDVIFESLTTEREELFKVKGSIFSFSEDFISNYRKEWSTTLDINNFEFILEDTFKEASDKYEEIQDIIKNLINYEKITN